MDQNDVSQIIDLRDDEFFKDRHAIAHAMGERFVSEDCKALLIGLGLLELPGGIS